MDSSLVKSKGGVAFVLQDENARRTVLPRRLQPINLNKEKVSINEILEKENAVQERRNNFLKDRLANLSHRRSVGRLALFEASRTLAAQRTLAQSDARLEQVSNIRQQIQSEKVNKVRNYIQSVLEKARTPNSKVQAELDALIEQRRQEQLRREEEHHRRREEKLRERTDNLPHKKKRPVSARTTESPKALKENCFNSPSNFNNMTAGTDKLGDQVEFIRNSTGLEKKFSIQ